MMDKNSSWQNFCDPVHQNDVEKSSLAKSLIQCRWLSGIYSHNWRQRQYTLLFYISKASRRAPLLLRLNAHFEFLKRSLEFMEEKRQVVHSAKKPPVLSQNQWAVHQDMGWFLTLTTGANCSPVAVGQHLRGNGLNKKSLWNKTDTKLLVWTLKHWTWKGRRNVYPLMEK